jgi:hypothetical protein
MGVPPDLGVDAGDNQARNSDARNAISTPSPSKMSEFLVIHPLLPCYDANVADNCIPLLSPDANVYNLPGKTH